jgi:Carboxypeptidase regulatory-like domain/TonB dependent receptor
MIAVLVALLALGPSAQPREARVAVTVVDQTGAVIPNAKVTVTSVPEAKALPATTNEKGVASLAGLAPGRYTIQAEFPGFEPRLLKDLQIKPGDNRHVVVLAIQGLQDSVTVSRDAREAASDRRSTFGTALTREQIEALSDDPDEMTQQLQDIAGGNAVIRVDSFEGGRLPPKSAIKAIHITRDAFAAENHFAGGLFIDIITQPGIGPLRTNMNIRFRDGSFSGAPPAAFAEQQRKGPERTQTFFGGIGGSLIKQKASFSLSVNGNTQYDTPYFYYVTPDGQTINSLAPRRPRDNMFVYGLFDYAITRDQTLRVNYNRDSFSSHNLGVGGYDQLERGYSTENANHTVRIQEAGPLGRRFFTNTRASINWTHSSARSLFEAQTIHVIEAFTSGGQQRTGGGHSRTINLQSDLDYVRGMHSVRTGVQLDGGSYHSNDSSNYIGTYTFESLDAFLAGTPRSFTQRIGNPNIDYWNLQAGLYLQDDIRVRKNLTLSPGVRYEAQTHLSDLNNFGPRFGVTWSPGKTGKTTLRGSAGIFYDWLFTNVYEQTLRVDGFRQQELNIINPTFPVPSGVGSTSPTNRYLLADNLQMQRNTRFSAGIDRQLTRMVRVNATYAHLSGENLMRGQNLNAPVDRQRPDPRFSNVVQVVGDGESRGHTLNVGASINFNAPPAGGSAAGGPIMINGGAGMMMIAGAPPPPPPPGAARTAANARWNWRRLNVFTNLGLGRTLNNTDGPFAMPATGRIEDDWGPWQGDIRRRVNVAISSQQLRNFNVNLNFNAASAPPYTIRTGVDTNGDLVFTDRPAGVGRNSARGSGQWTLNGNFSYSRQFGKPQSMPGGISIRSEGGGLAASQTAGQSVGRYRVSFNASVQNITNHANLIGYSGVQTSPKFGLPTAFIGTRKVDFGVGISF